MPTLAQLVGGGGTRGGGTYGWSPEKEKEEEERLRRQKMEAIQQRTEELRKEAEIGPWRRAFSKEMLGGAVKELFTKPKEAFRKVGEELKPAGQYIARQAKYVKEEPEQAAQNVGMALIDFEEKLGETISALSLPKAGLAPGLAFTKWGKEPLVKGTIDTYIEVNKKNSELLTQTNNSLLDKYKAETDPARKQTIKELISRNTNEMQKAQVNIEKEVPAFTKTPLQIAGEFGGVALDILLIGVGSEALEQLGKLSAKELAKAGAKEGLKLGIPMGAGYGTTGAIAEGARDWKQIAISGGIGAVAGGVLGAGAGATLGAIKGILTRGKLAKAGPKGAISATKEAEKKAKSIVDFINKEPNLEVTQVKTLGKDQTGKKIASRLEWDQRAGKGTMYVTPGTTEDNLAHEIGHFLDKSITPEERIALLVEAESVAGKQVTPNETFARGIAEVIKAPDKTKAPGLTSYLEGKGLMFEKPGVAKLAEPPKVRKGKLPAKLSEAEANVRQYKDLQSDLIDAEAKSIREVEGEAFVGLKPTEEGYVRVSGHGKAYSEYYKEYGRKPGLAFWKKQAKQDLQLGKGQYGKDYIEAQRMIDEAATKVKGERAVTRAQLGGVKEAIQPEKPPIEKYIEEKGMKFRKAPRKATITGYRFSKGKVGTQSRAGTFYSLSPQGRGEGKYTIKFKNLLSIPQEEVHPFEGMPSEGVLKRFGITRREINNFIKNNKLEPIEEEGLAFDILVAKKVKDMGYDGIKYGNLEIQDVRSFNPKKYNFQPAPSIKEIGTKYRLPAKPPKRPGIYEYGKPKRLVEPMVIPEKGYWEKPTKVKAYWKQEKRIQKYLQDRETGKMMGSKVEKFREVPSGESVSGRAIKDSGITLYHGTSEISARGIKKVKGFQIRKSVHGTWIMGEGIYLTPSRREASLFGKRIIEADLNPKVKLLNINPGTQWQLMLEANKKYPNIKVEKAITKLVKKKGYDGLRMTQAGTRGEDYISIFDPQNIKITKYRLKDDFKRITGITINDQKEKDIIALNKRVFGDEDVKITAQILTPEGQKALGSYRDGIIKIVNGQAEVKETFYHEAAHKAFDLFTTADEQADIIRTGMKRFGLKDFDAVEEKMAEDFIKYAKSREGVSGTIKLVYDKIINRVKSFMGSENEISRFYTDLVAGKKGLPAKPGEVIFKPTKVTAGGIKPLEFEKIKTPSYNTNLINATEDIDNLIAMTSKQFQKQRRGTIGNDQLKELSFMTGVNADEIAKAKPGSILNAESALASRQIMMDQALQLSEFSRSITGRATPEQLGMFKKMLNDFKATQRSVAGFRTESGRLLQQFNMEIKPGENAALEDLVKQVSRIDVGAAKGIDKVANLNKIAQPTNMSNIVGLWKAGLLSTPHTHIVNLVGNAAMVTLRSISDYPATAGDIFVSIFTKKRAKAVGGIGARARGTWEGIEEGASVIKKAFASMPVSTKADIYREVRFKNKILDMTIGNLARGVFGALDAADRPFYRSAYRSSITDQAKVVAKNTGKSVKSLIASPTDDMVKMAISDAESAVFRGSNILSSAAAGGKKPLGPIGEAIMPFTRTPSGIAMEMINYSPIGLPVEIATQIAKKQFNQRALSEALGRAVTGTAVLWTGTELAKRGLMTGTYPTKPSEQNLWRQQGKDAYSIKIGDKWYSLKRIQPFGNILGVGADMYNIAKREGNQKAMTSFLATIGKSMAEQSFLQGLSKSLEAVNNPEQYAGKWLEGMAAGMIPGVIGAVARGMDPFFRKKKGIKEAIKTRVPGLSKQLEPYYDIFGKPSMRPPSYPGGKGVLGQLFGIMRGSPEIADDLIKELNRLNETGNIPSLTDISSSGGRADAFKSQVSREKYEEFLRDYGDEYKAQMTSLIREGWYKDLTDEEKKDELNSIKKKVTDWALNKYGYQK